MPKTLVRGVCRCVVYAGCEFECDQLTSKNFTDTMNQHDYFARVSFAAVSRAPAVSLSVS